jgi:hypothetical protein
MQRPSKKPGYCFKIWHPLEKSIWIQRVYTHITAFLWKILFLHSQGPNNEQFGALTFPLPMNYLICRASDDTTGLFFLFSNFSFLIMKKK